ncbi:DUF4314 domain-containing protein [Microbacterium pumilum]|uniref:DUF4314 domain-containing protein n=1 Tax=Microbacterium pumilum TaxID=344165 RepID=A0ABN2T2H2_9MICO
MANPTQRQVREYLMADNGWAGEEVDAFLARHGGLLDGVGVTRATTEEWTLLAMSHNEEQSPEEVGVDGVTLPGARICLIATTDEYTRLEPGAMGTVELIDDAGTVHVHWDTGETLGLIPGEDTWAPLHPRWDAQHMEQVHPASDAEENR